MEPSDIEELNIHQYIDCFEKKLFENERFKFHCKVANCKSVLSDAPSAIRHLKRNHRDIYDTIDKSKVEKLNKKISENLIELRVKVDPKQILKASVDLITKHALPLRFVEYPAFQTILRPYKIALALKGIELVINRTNVKDYIEENAKQIKKTIKSGIRGKLICLMIDIASHYNRSVLGVNIAYVVDGKVIIRTIGMHVLHCTQTAINIVNVIKKNLSDFGISLSNIISVTSDNGKNMIKSVALLDSAYQKEKELLNETVVETAETVSESDDDEGIDDDIFDETYYEDLLNNVRHQFNDFIYTDLIQGVSCAAHCFHLIVTKSIAQCEESAKLIEKCRNLSIKLRTPTFREMLLSRKLKSATVDVSTRWNSTYIMIKNLLKLKTFCDELHQDTKIKHCLLDENEWIEVERLSAVLRPFFKYVEKLQAVNCTLSDFFGYWISIRLNMEKRDHPLKHFIVNEMEKYKVSLLQNPVLAAAVYLDPRYQRVLSVGEKRLACTLLKNIYIKYQMIKEVEIQPQTNSVVNNDDSDSFNDMMEYLNSFSNETERFGQINTINVDDVDNAIRSFDGKRESSMQVSPLEYWEKHKTEMPHLYELSQAIFAIPPTQSSVERTFSALPIILTAKRTRISDECLQNILLLKNNQNIHP